MLQREIRSRIQDNPLKYYWPHAYGCDGTKCTTNEHTHTDYYGTEYTIKGCPQYEFHTAISPIHTAALFGANRSGKTVAGVVEDAFHATGYYPDWYPEAKKFREPTKGRIFARDFRVVQEVIIPELLKWLPKGSIKDKHKNNIGVYTKWYIKHSSGKTSSFDIMTYEMQEDQCEGWSGHWVHWDEPPPRAHRSATVRGLTDYGGYEYFSLTPLKEPWIFDEVYENPRATNVTCDIRHNLHRPNPLTGDNIGLTEENIRITESKWMPEEVEARGRGKFRFLAGRIWKEWDRAIHTFDRSMWKAGEHGVRMDGQPPEDWKKIMLIDPHDRKPHAILWATMEPQYKRIFIYREAWLQGYKFSDAVKHIMKEEIKYRELVNIRIMDPNFGPKNNANTNRTVRAEFEDASRAENYPMEFTFGDDHKELGRKRVAEMLYYDKMQPISIINRPDIMVAKDCLQCIYQIEHYIWDDFKLGERDPKEKPKDINTHYPDLFQYMALYNWDGMDAEIIQGSGSYYV